jgi:hypothetical protein
MFDLVLQMFSIALTRKSTTTVGTCCESVVALYKGSVADGDYERFVACHKGLVTRYKKFVTHYKKFVTHYKGLLPTTKVCYPLRKFRYPAKKGGHSSTSTAQELPKTPQAPIGDLPPGPQTFLRWADKIFAS